MELHEREVLIARARHLIETYNYDVSFALDIAEQELQEQKKKYEIGGNENEQ